MKKITVLLLLVALVSCVKKDSEREPIRKKIPRYDVVGEFKSKVYQINQDEHITVFDVPSWFVQNRCIVFVSESTKTSHMKCYDDDGSAIPDYAGAADK